MSTKNLNAFFKLYKEVKAKQFDIFIGVWETARYAVLSWLCRIPVRVGLNWGQVNFIFYNKLVSFDPRNFDNHQLDWNNGLLKALNIIVDNPKMQVSIDLERMNALKEKFPWLNHPYCVITISSKISSKSLSLENYGKIIDYLLQRSSLQIVLDGLVHESGAYKDRLSSYISSERVKDLIGMLSLTDLACIISEADLVIAPDSGVTHIAAALGKNTLTYYLNREQNPSRWFPRQCHHYIVYNRPACKKKCQPEYCLNTICRRDVDLAEFFRGIEYLLGNSLDNHNSKLQALTVLLLGRNTESYKSMLSDYKIYFNEINSDASLFQIAKALIENNSNVLLLVSIKKTIKHKLACLYASNFITFFPKLVHVNTISDLKEYLFQFGDVA
ncbi:glycosyltransferase family 9 protein [Thermoproteota archaeon]